MIQTLLPLAIANALIIYGLYSSARFDWKQEGNTVINYKTVKESDVDPDSKMIFWRLHFYSLKFFGTWWSKPILTCPICMASIHSLYIYWFQHPLSIRIYHNNFGTFMTLPPTLAHDLYLYALHILMTAGVGAIIIQFQKS